MSQFLHDDDNDDAKAVAITRIFSENNRTRTGEKKLGYFFFENCDLDI